MAEELKVDKIIEKMNLKILTPDIPTENKKVTVPDINRPALQLAGFFTHFDSERVQIIGHVETAYLETLDAETKRERYEKLLSSNVPCIVFCRNEEPDEVMIQEARKYQIPLLQTDKTTSSFEAEMLFPKLSRANTHYLLLAQLLFPPVLLMLQKRKLQILFYYFQLLYK